MFQDDGPAQNSCLRTQVWPSGENLLTGLGSQAKLVPCPPRAMVTSAQELMCPSQMFGYQLHAGLMLGLGPW